MKQRTTPTNAMLFEVAMLCFHAENSTAQAEQHVYMRDWYRGRAAAFEQAAEFLLCTIDTDIARMFHDEHEARYREIMAERAS